MIGARTVTVEERAAVPPPGWPIVIVTSVVFALAAILLLIFVPMNSSRVRAVSPAQALRDLQAEVPHLPVPLRDGEVLGAAIRARQLCFSESRTLSNRTRICIPAYARPILAHAHRSVKVNVGLTDFMNRLASCPAIANICRGETLGTPEACFDRELECVYYAMDRYRYGSRTAKPLR